MVEPMKDEPTLLEQTLQMLKKSQFFSPNVRYELYFNILGYGCYMRTFRTDKGYVLIINNDERTTMYNHLHYSTIAYFISSVFPISYSQHFSINGRKYKLPFYKETRAKTHKTDEFVTNDAPEEREKLKENIIQFFNDIYSVRSLELRCEQQQIPKILERKARCLDMLKREIRNIFEGAYIGDAYEEKETYCNTVNARKYWKNEKYGPLISMCILSSCYVHSVNMEDVAEAWLELRRKIEKVSNYNFIEMYQKFNKNRTYARQLYNFLYDYYVYRGLNCVGGCLFVYVLNKLSNQPKRMILRRLRNHIDVVYIENSVLKNFETTRNQSFVKSHEPHTTAIPMSGEQVIALYSVTRNVYYKPIDLSTMFGDTSKSFEEFAFNAQQPRITSRLDGFAFAMILCEYYIAHYRVRYEHRHVGMKRIRRAIPDSFIDIEDEIYRYFYDPIDNYLAGATEIFINTVKFVADYLKKCKIEPRDFSFVDEDEDKNEDNEEELEEVN